MKNLDDIYPLFSKGNIALLAGGGISLILGIILFFVGQAELVGLIILLSTFIALPGILFTTAILSLLSRRLIRKQTVGIRGSILFINKSHSWKNPYIKEFINLNIPQNFHKSIVTSINKKIRSELGWSLCMTLGRETGETKLSTFDPVTFCYLKDEGEVIIKWGTMRKKVAGLQIGNKVEVDLSVGLPNSSETVVSLIRHELWHVLLSKEFPGSGEAWQHTMMSFK